MFLMFVRKLYARSRKYIWEYRLNVFVSSGLLSSNCGYSYRREITPAAAACCLGCPSCDIHFAHPVTPSRSTSIFLPSFRAINIIIACQTQRGSSFSTTYLQAAITTTVPCFLLIVLLRQRTEDTTSSSLPPVATIEMSSRESNADDAGQGVRLQHGVPGQSAGTKHLYSKGHVPKRYKDNWGGDMEKVTQRLVS